MKSDPDPFDMYLVIDRESGKGHYFMTESDAREYFNLLDKADLLKELDYVLQVLEVKG